MNLKIIHKSIVIILFTLIFSTASVLACTCGDGGISIAQAKNDADIVFLGKAVETKYQKGAIYPTGQPAGEELAVRFEVERWWKGGTAPEIILFAEEYQSKDFTLSISDCAFKFEVGKRYVVFASVKEWDGKPRADYCSRTSEAEKAGKDVKQLGKWRKPKAT